MSFLRYPRYKDSGVEWLGPVPEHWEVVQYKQFVEIQNGSDHKHVERSEGYPVFGSGGVFAYASEFLYDGESILLGRKGTVDKPLYVIGKFWTVDTMYWTKIKGDASGRYIFYLAVTIPFDYYSTNTALPSMTKGALNGHLVTCPPLLEQAAIANYLDQETSKIDALIAEQQRLIELLKEKRQAVISHAVTKGLDPNAPMKDSGVEWLGMVPEHWDVGRVKRLVRSIEQGWSPQCEGYPAENRMEWGILKVGCVNAGIFNPNENKLLPPDLQPNPALGLSSGDLLISRANTRELVGSAAVVQDDHPNLMLCDKLYRVRLDPLQMDPRYLSLVLGCQGVRGEIELEATGASSSMLNIGQGTILNLVIPIPSRSDQSSIVRAIEVQTSRLDALAVEAERAIELLGERRSALIAAAVTGQIDVRNA